MKRIGTALRAAVSLGLCAALLAGCSLLPSDPAPEQPVPTDPLTGQEQLWPGQRPVAVSIENASDSTTQWGLSTASVVLEAPTELQGSTRLCLVYPSVNAVPQVGPVAAGEDLYWRLLVGQQVIPVQRGGGQFDQNYLDYYSLRPVDALEAGRNAFSCPAGWSNTPLWYTGGSALSSALETLNISSTLTESRVTTAASAAADSTSGEDTPLTIPALLPQSMENKVPDATAPDAVNVRLQFDEQNATGFAYDAESATYKMLHADGTPQLDANSGQQAAFDNLLVLFSASALRDDEQTFDYDLSMGGGVWLNGGHLWTITWTQGQDNTLLLYDADGRTMNIEAGTSYIALVTSLTGQELTVTGETQGSDGKTWYAVTFDNVSGYIRSDLVEAHVSEATAEPTVDESQETEEPEEEPIVDNSADYSVAFEDDGSGSSAWYLHDNTMGTRYQVSDLLNAEETNKNNQATIDQTAKSMRFVVILMAFVIVVLIIVVTILIIKVRSTYEDYDDYDDDEEDDEEDEDDDEDEDEEEERPRRKKGKSKDWQSRNFLDDDDLEFEFLDLK